MAEKLTDRTAKTNDFDDADVFHLVDVSDTSQDPAGSSFKVECGDYFTEYLEPKINALSIPLAGTIFDNPVTGDIEFDPSIIVKLFSDDLGGNKTELKIKPDEIGFLGYASGSLTAFILDGTSIGFEVNDLTGPTLTGMTFESGIIEVKSGAAGFRGISGDVDYSANITDVDYTQKIYVDSVIAPSIQRVTPATAGTVTATAGKKNHTVMVDTALLAALTINLPSSPVDGQICKFVSVGGVTALTLVAPGGASISNPITALVAIVGAVFQYNDSNTTWYRSV